MSNLDLTASNSTFTITVQGLYNAPVQLANYAADRMWETDERELTEDSMSVDGYLNAGWVANAVNQTIHLQASSDSCEVFEAIVAAQDVGRTVYRIGGEIRIPALKRAYTMINGFIRATSPVPSAGRILEVRQFRVRWQQILPAGI